MYKTGLVEHITNTTDILNITAFNDPNPGQGAKVNEKNGIRDDSGPGWSWRQYENLDSSNPVEHKDLEMWKQLSYNHWPTLFSYYNISLYGRSVVQI